MFPIKKLINPVSLFKSLVTKPLMKMLKFPVKIMTEFSEKIPNGYPMDQELPPPLMLSTSDYLDSIFIILKLIPIQLFSELLEFTMLNLPKEEPPTVSLFKTMKTITGNSVLSMEAQLLIGSVLFLKFLDYPAPKKEKEKPLFKKLWSPNLY